jgi:hypothetical protein
VSGERLSTWTRWLGVVLGVGYLAAGIGGWIGDVTDGDGSDLAFWLLFLCGGGVLVLVALFAGLPRAGALVLAIVGALAGAIALVWSIVVPLLAIAFVVLLVLRFRAETPATA